MAEADLWATVRDRLKYYGHLDRIENLVGVGRPDVNYCIRSVEGNIELKHAARWPARGGALPLKHYTPAQRNWARDRMRAGGRVYVLLQVGRWYGLFHGEWARLNLGLTATEFDCQVNALVQGEGQFPYREILAQLTGDFTFPAR